MENLEFSHPETNTENPNPLYSYLDQPVAFVIPDRSLTPFGRRTLKSLRAARSKWPLPGAYSCADMAVRILKKLGQYRPVIDELEAYAYLAEHRPDTGLLEVKDELDLAKRVRKLASVDLLAKIVSHEEYKDQLSPALFGAIYSCLLLEKLAEERDCEAHAFSHVEKAAALVRASPDCALDFHRFRPDAERTLIVIGFRDLYPAERALLSALQARFKLVKQLVPRPPEGNSPPVLAPRALASGEQLLWVSHLDPPGPLEAQRLARQPAPVRVALDRKVRAFNPIEQKLSEDWTKHAPLLEKLIDPNSSPRAQALIRRMMTEAEPALAGVLKSLGFFGRQEIDRLINARVEPSSTTLFDAEDAPLLDPARALVWGTQETWTEFLTALGSGGQHLRISDELEKILLAEGVVLPQLVAEQAALKSVLEEWGARLARLELARDEDYRTSERPYAAKAKPQKLLSPSGLESLARCPLQFHFGREMRLPIVEIPDDLEGSALRRGVWIHGVLERVNFRDLKNLSLGHLQKILHDELEKSFKSFASPSYLKILQAQVKGLAEAIYFYLEKLERPLTELFPFRKVEREKDIECQWSERLGLRGRVDRLDFVGEGAFLWDYKTSNYSGTKFSTLIENGRFQWLLYREIFERDGVPIYGGGYLNPLDLKKSRLIFFEHAPLPDSFYDFLDENGVRVERVKAAEERELRDLVRARIEKLIDAWKSPDRPAAPLNARVCDDCDFVGYCGYPYGVTP